MLTYFEDITSLEQAEGKPFVSQLGMLFTDQHARYNSRSTIQRFGIVGPDYQMIEWSGDGDHSEIRSS